MKVKLSISPINAWNLEIQNWTGLMTIAPLTNDRNLIRKSFKYLSKLKVSLNSNGIFLSELSMGMDRRFDIAIEEVLPCWGSALLFSENVIIQTRWMYYEFSPMSIKNRNSVNLSADMTGKKFRLSLLKLSDEFQTLQQENEQLKKDLDAANIKLNEFRKIEKKSSEHSFEGSGIFHQVAWIYQETGKPHG